MIPYKADPSVPVVTVGIRTGENGYYVRMPHGISGGCIDVGPMRLDTAVMVAKEQIDAYVAIHKQFLGGSK